MLARHRSLMASPLVSVVIPSYNRAHVVGEAIKSVLGQSHDAVEVVLVDDGSTDETPDRIKRDWGNDSRVRYFRKENGGPSTARNFGFKEARGAYVALLDSDDTWQPWKLSVQIGCMEKYRQVGMTWTDMAMIDPSGAVADPNYLRHMYTAYRWFTNDQLFPESYPLREIAPDFAGAVGDARFRIGQIFSNMIMGNLVHTSTVVLRRERLDQIKGFDESLGYPGEDYDFHLRTCREGPVGLIDVPAIRYQQGMADRLTARKYQFKLAQNLLRTLEPVIQHERDKIQLPEKMLRQKLAEAHAWFAYENLERGDSDVSRKHYLQSLRYWPWQPEVLKPFTFAALPFGTGVVLRKWLRTAKARILGTQAESST